MWYKIGTKVHWAIVTKLQNFVVSFISFFTFRDLTVITVQEAIEKFHTIACKVEKPRSHFHLRPGLITGHLWMMVKYLKLFLQHDIAI